MDNLRIIADDLGLAVPVNEGILLALKNGWIDGASLMPTGNAFSEAVVRLTEVPHAAIGVHVVLVEEKPLSKKEAIPSLVRPDGLFLRNHRVFFMHYILGVIDLKDIEREVRLQIETCVTHGIRPSYINSHQHLHLLPGITDIFIKLAKEYDIPYIRIVSEPWSGMGGSFLRKLQSQFLRVLSYRAVRAIDTNGLKRNDLFVGFNRAGNLTIGDIRFARKIARVEPAVMVELGCHPGFEDEQLRKTYTHWGDYHWKRELDSLEQAAVE